MPVLTGKLKSWGPMVQIKVMQSPQRVAALKKAQRNFSSPTTVLGLLDTGASCSVLDPQVIGILDLDRRGVISIHTPSTGSGFVNRDQFDVSFVLGETDPNPLVLTLPVIQSELATQGFFALIGRDVLRHCVFTCDGPKDTFTLEF